MLAWYALLDGPHADTVPLKQHFGSAGITFDEIDGKFAIAAPAFEECKERDYECAIDAATELLELINISLRISSAAYSGFDLHSLVEKRDGHIHRVMIARAAVYRLSGVSAVATVGSIGKRVQSKEERLVWLMKANDAVADIARGLAVRPITWAALTKAYETIVGTMSKKANPNDARSDYANLVTAGWLTDDESKQFYHTAAYHRKGYPKSPPRTQKQMSHDGAIALIDRLFWRLVDELEPN